MVSSQPQQTHIYHSMSEAVNEAEQPAQPPVAEQSSNKQLVVEGQTVTLVTAGVGRGIQTSSIWKYLVEFEPPVGRWKQKEKRQVYGQEDAAGLGIDARTPSSLRPPYEVLAQGQEHFGHWNDRLVEPLRKTSQGDIRRGDGSEPIKHPRAEEESPAYFR